MNNIKITYTGAYLPDNNVTNKELSSKYDVSEDYIYKRTGIKKRRVSDKNIEDIALEAVKNLLKNDRDNIEINNIDMIIVATTSSNCIMPGISNYIQKKLQIQKCICMDILAGCAGFINAFDIARTYIAIGKTQKCLVIGVDKLTDCIDKNDLGTEILFADGAGAVILEKTEENKKYSSLIESEGQNNEILEYKSNDIIKMDGVKVYKYAISRTVENITDLLEQSKEDICNIKYIIPHQSNYKIMKSIESRLKCDSDKIYINIENIGNTFCASIPIALDEINKKELINRGDKLILLGYGGGLNTASILIEF